MSSVLIDNYTDDHVIFPEGHYVTVSKYEIFFYPDESPRTFSQIFEHILIRLIRELDNEVSCAETLPLR